ncbi:hypothetical protein OTU49_014116 [Cherax quadricarinatus]|uniref:Uncharacterized protein n=1 Tax=Cherax quadricarinatus TaxID=27406 RepID=A0AAW0VQT3_CHEQU
MLVCDRCEMRYVDETRCAVMCSSCVKEEGIRFSHLDNKCRSCGLIYCLDGECACPGCSFIPYGEFVCYKCELVMDNLLLHECNLGEEKGENLQYDVKISTPFNLQSEDITIEDPAPIFSVWTGLQNNKNNKNGIERANDHLGLSHPKRIATEFRKECEETMKNGSVSLNKLKHVSANSHRDDEEKPPKRGEGKQGEKSHGLEILNPVRLRVENAAVENSTPVSTIWTGLQYKSSSNNTDDGTENLKVMEQAHNYSNLSHFDEENEITKEEFYEEEETEINLEKKLNIVEQPVFCNSHKDKKSSKQGEKKQGEISHDLGFSSPVQSQVYFKNRVKANSAPALTVWTGQCINRTNNSDGGIKNLKVEEADYSDISHFDGAECEFTKEEFSEEETNKNVDTNWSKMEHHVFPNSEDNEKSPKQGEKQGEKFPCSLEISNPVNPKVENTAMEDAATTITVWTGLQCSNNE